MTSMIEAVSGSVYRCQKLFNDNVVDKFNSFSIMGGESISKNKIVVLKNTGRKHNDPFLDLPVEIVSKIIGFSSNSLANTRHLRRVSKKFDRSVKEQGGYSFAQKAKKLYEEGCPRMGPPLYSRSLNDVDYDDPWDWTAPSYDLKNLVHGMKYLTELEERNIINETLSNEHGFFRYIEKQDEFLEKMKLFLDNTKGISYKGMDRIGKIMGYMSFKYENVKSKAMLLITNNVKNEDDKNYIVNSMLHYEASFKNGADSLLLSHMYRD